MTYPLLGSLLGSTLVKPDGSTISVQHALSGKNRIGLYFSANWCAPCKQFTPLLAKWFKSHSVAEGCEVIFCSLDRDMQSFKEYHSKMPWLALPFKDDCIQVAADKFSVEGIPSLIWLDAATQRVITAEGVELLTSRPDTAWPFGVNASGNEGSKSNARDSMPGVWGMIQNAKLIDAQGKSKTAADLHAGNRSIGLYFSAHWCPPCRSFTPVLAAWYKTHKDAANLDIIFVSADKTKSDFDEYRAEMPWLALSFDERRLQASLSSAFDVRGIPALITFDSTGEPVCKAARGFVTSDPEGWPWAGKADEAGCNVQ